MLKLVLLFLLTSLYTPLFAKASLTIEEAKSILKNIPIYIQEEQYGEGIIDLKKAKSVFKNQKLVVENISANLALSELYAFVDPQQMLNFADSAAFEINPNIPDASTLRLKSDLYKANALLQLNDFDTAKEIFQYLTKEFKQLNDLKNALDCEYSLAFIEYYKANYEKAEIHIANGLEIDEQLSEDILYKNLLISLASAIAFQKGDYQKAINLNLEIIHIIESMPNRNPQQQLNLVQFYSNLGAYYNRKGEFKRALDCYAKIEKKYNQEPLKILNQFPKHYNNKGKILFKNGAYKESILSLKNSIIPINLPNEKKQRKFITAFNHLGMNYIQINQLDSATYYLNKAFAIPLTYKKEWTHLYLAEVEIAKNESQLALKNLESSYKIYLSNNKQNQNYIIYYFELYSKVHQSNQDYVQALKATQRALVENVNNFKDSINIYANPTLTNVAFPTNLLESIHQKAKLFTQRSPSEKDQKAALATYQLATQWIDSLQNSYVLEGSQLFWSNKFKEIYEEAITLNYQFYQKTGESKYLKTAFDLTEKSKALLLLEGLKDNAGQVTASLPDSLTQKEKDLKVAVAFYEKSLQTATEKNQEDRVQLYQSYLADNRLELARLKEQMEADYPTYYALKYANNNISIEEMPANMLTDQQVFINYFLGKQKSYAFVVGKDFSEFLELAPIDTIQPKGQAFLQLLKNPSLFQQNAKLAFQNYNQAAFELYQLVFQQISSKIPSSTNQLIISPDGILNQVPFAALTTKLLPQQSMDFGQLPYLLHRYPIHYAYSANLLWNNRQKQQQRPPNSQLLAYAPSYQSNGKIAELRGGSADLVGTKTEIQAIANYFEGDFQNNELATKNHFQANAVHYGLLHLAMHGEGNSKTGSHLIFTDQNQSEKTAHFLHDYEIANMDLTAQLAVLSACETGVGEYVDGEGVFSLARSFMYAGVPSIAMSLWQVNDLTTSQIMPEFYKNLANGSSKAKSLHQAKQAFLATADLEYRHPYYWSGFVLLGDGQALKMDSLFGGWLWGTGLACMLIGAWGYFRSRK